ncbi:N utilization substance protein B [Methylacidimicrobium tartarophylax]|uniref:Transcription antitermination protein NusB n=2 Tax=Methylacidimicrobium tartarophylax TaxID=1041768 RepID=A0A5E6MQD6_9BACT|nr:N utilization substance protein B [Methylacidimicrobium tartarophylax]
MSEGPWELGMAAKKGSMSPRRTARIRAVQFLYQWGIRQQPASREILEDFWALSPASASVRRFAEDLILGAIDHVSSLDERIEEYVENWQIERLAAVDRSILRVALYELFFRGEIPPVVSVNEAVEVAKQLSSEESGRFVNGVLDRALRDVNRPLRAIQDGGGEA